METSSFLGHKLPLKSLVDERENVHIRFMRKGYSLFPSPRGTSIQKQGAEAGPLIPCFHLPQNLYGCGKIAKT